MAKKRRQHSRHDDLRPQPRIGLGLDERPLEESLGPLEVVTRALAEPPQHRRAFGTGFQLVEQRLEDLTRSHGVAARVVMVGREQPPTAQNLPAGSGRRERDRERGQLGCRPRSPTQGRDRRGALQFVGDCGRRAARAESKVPGALLGIADQLGEPAMQRSPPERIELGLDARGQQGVAETNTLVIKLEDRRGRRGAKPPTHCRGVGCHCLDDRDRGLPE